GTLDEVAALKEELQRLGWKEGRNIRFEIRLGVAALENREGVAKELVALQPDVIFTSGTPQTAAVLGETHTIPIVFGNVSDPVGSRFAASLARPGGNVTGFTNFVATVAQKWLELLKEIAPNVTRVGVIFNPDTAVNAGQYFFEPIEIAARARKIETF